MGPLVITCLITSAVTPYNDVNITAAAPIPTDLNDAGTSISQTQVVESFIERSKIVK